ncbi:MAG: hypothetical protein J0I71_00290 [Rhodanobacter sp.]|nr:hypothetical protein [Rhodanobacter sp.]OJW29951.1 MAG: hypothetical protein BGO50_08850 [Rhodanobacter sp. 67-28]
MPTMPGDPVLPEQSPHTLQEKIEQVRQRQALLAQWRATGSPELMKQAEVLEGRYHTRDVGELADDVYLSAAHEPASPGLGWIRVSEHPELLKQYLGVNWSAQQIQDYLQPLHSDFRAEIYLPDPRVYGPDVKPVIVIKGSNGLVAVPDGKGGIILRESALEDWIENGRQGVGLESDHADRAMTLISDFQRDFHGIFECAGHSKGAASASAGAELTGMTAYIYNGAGLHPNTVQRYAQQHHLPVLGTDRIIHSYYVHGEMLHDAQSGAHDMDAVTRAQLGLAARQLGELGQLDGMQDLLRARLAQALPYDRKMQDDAMELVAYLSSHSGAKILAGVPLAAGAHPIELPPKMRDAQGQLVDRPAQPSLGELGADAGPLMNVVSGALAGGAGGKRVGDAIAAGGRGIEHSAQRTGDHVQRGMQVFGYVLNEGVQGHGRLVAGAMHYGAAAVADLRVVHGEVRASVERGLGTLAQLSADLDGAVLRAGSHVPGLQGLRQVADNEARLAAARAGHHQAQADREWHEAQRDAGAIRRFADVGADRVRHASSVAGQTLEREARQGGARIGDGYRAYGASVRRATEHAPEAGAAVGAVAGAGAVAAGELLTHPAGTVRQSSHVAQHGEATVAEAVNRHSMKDTVLPSLDADIRRQEHAGMALLHTLQRPATSARMPATVGQDPSAFVQGMLDSAQSGNWDAFRQGTRTLASLPAGQALHAEAMLAVDRQQQAAAWQALSPQQAEPQAAALAMMR